MDMQNDDMKQDVDMISQVLRKIADEMDLMEANRLTPADKMPKMAAPVAPTDPSEEMPDMGSDDESDDSSLLPSLMDKAGSADDEGSLPEDKEDDVDPEIAGVIAAKKKLLPK